MKERSHQGESCVIGIDVGGTNLRFALVAEGKIVSRHRDATAGHLGLTPLIHRIVSGMDILREEASRAGRRVRAAGVGLPGLIAADGFVHSSVNLTCLEGKNIRNILAEAAGLPVIAVNDANAIAYGERCFGAGRSLASFLLLTIGTGIGSGLVLDGRLWGGRDGFAAEFGHATVEAEGNPCPCGNRGCLEQYASATAIVAKVRAEVRRGRESLLADLPDQDITAARVARAAEEGDLLAGEVFDRAGRYLGQAAATALNLLNLEAIILGGGVAASFSLLEEPMRREMEQRTFGEISREVRIVRGSLGDDAGLLGSAALAAALP